MTGRVGRRRAGIVGMVGSLGVLVAPPAGSAAAGEPPPLPATAGRSVGPSPVTVREAPWALRLLAPQTSWPLTRGAGVVVAVVDTGGVGGGTLDAYAAVAALAPRQGDPPVPVAAGPLVVPIAAGPSRAARVAGLTVLGALVVALLVAAATLTRAGRTRRRRGKVTVADLPGQHR
ncbi:hypothetical protein [Micromonospora humida]|uniref:hypothetical protein n=1 Tax=Micromonospora humida TaxID=2809018 RepID=UPI00343C4105